MLKKIVSAFQRSMDHCCDSTAKEEKNLEQIFKDGSNKRKGEDSGFFEEKIEGFSIENSEGLSLSLIQKDPNSKRSVGTGLRFCGKTTGRESSTIIKCKSNGSTLRKESEGVGTRTRKCTLAQKDQDKCESEINMERTIQKEDVAFLGGNGVLPMMMYSLDLIGIEEEEKEEKKVHSAQSGSNGNQIKGGDEGNIKGFSFGTINHSHMERTPEFNWKPNIPEEEERGPTCGLNKVPIKTANMRTMSPEIYKGEKRKNAKRRSLDHIHPEKMQKYALLQSEKRDNLLKNEPQNIKKRILSYDKTNSPSMIASNKKLVKIKKSLKSVTKKEKGLLATKFKYNHEVALMN